MITKPLKCLTHAPQFSKLREHELNRFANPPIRMQHNLTRFHLRIPNREPFEQFAAARFGLLPRLHSLTQNLQLDHAQRSFDAQHQLIVQIIQIVDLLLISDQSSKNLTHLQEPAPILVRAGQS